MVTLLNNSAVARAPVPSCTVNPAAGEAASTIVVDVTVLNDPGSTVTQVMIALGPENPGGILCGATSASVSGGVAHFSLGVDFGVPPPTCAVLPGFCTYTLTATAVGASSGVSAEFTISLAS